MREPALQVSVLYDGDVALVVLDGELDLATTELLHHVVSAALADGHPHLVLDLERLDFCDSTGFGTLLRADRRARAAGGSCVVAGARGTVARLFDATSAGTLLTTAPDTGTALGQVEPRA